MQRRLTALTAAAISLIPLSQPVLMGSISITTAAIAALLYNAPATAQDISAVARIAKTITVRIEGATQGSGVIVKKEGNRYTVLTAWHVVSGNQAGEELAITTTDNKQHLLEQGSIQRLGRIDMAVLTFSSPMAYEVAIIGDTKKVNYNDTIYVAGFPLSNSQNLRYEAGDVVANAEVGIDQGYQLLYDNKTEAGMSGGVLLNSKGQLIGLHGRGEKDEYNTNQKEGSLKTGVNQGVPISYYKLFVSGEPVIATKSNATNADDYYAQILASANKKGREQTIIRLTNQALKLRRTSFAYIMRAYAKNDLGDYKGAIKDQTIALEIKPNNEVAYLNRGLAKFNIGDIKGSLTDFNKSININPSHAIAFSNRGAGKQFLGDPQGALADYKMALKINPRSDNAYANRCMTKRSLGDAKGAIADCNKAIEINPQNASAYTNRGNAKGDLGDAEGAISDYIRTIKISPNYPQPYMMLGIYKLQAKSYKESINFFNRAEKLGLGNVFVFNGRAWARYELKDYQGALLDTNKALELNPNDAATAAILDTQGLAKYALGKIQSGCKDLKMAVSLGAQPTKDYLNSDEGAWCRNM